MRAGRAASARRAFQPAGRRLSVQVMNANVLIANTKGGGHAFIGLYLAKELLKKGHKVTIMNDGDESKLVKKAPFNKYSELAREGASIAWGDPAKPSTYPRGNFDVVYDNNGKDMGSCQPMIDHFKHKVDHYVFVSSAGAYKADSIEPMHVEGDVRKATAGHVEVEAYLAQSRMPYTVFQPLYIYGPNTGKDCEQWFVDRIV
ncbi:Chloroplast stem-loop binding protein a, chloroplastic, partial [Tetrabaena socialis]